MLGGQYDLWKYRTVISGEFLVAGVTIAAWFMMWYKPEALVKKCQLYVCVCVALLFVRHPWCSPGSGNSQVRSLLRIPDLEGTAQRWWKPNQRYGRQMLSLFSLFVCLPVSLSLPPSPPPPHFMGKQFHRSLFEIFSYFVSSFEFYIYIIAVCCLVNATVWVFVWWKGWGYLILYKVKGEGVFSEAILHNIIHWMHAITCFEGFVQNPPGFHFILPCFG